MRLVTSLHPAAMTALSLESVLSSSRFHSVASCLTSFKPSPLVRNLLLRLPFHTKLCTAKCKIECHLRQNALLGVRLRICSAVRSPDGLP